MVAFVLKSTLFKQFCTTDGKLKTIIRNFQIRTLKSLPDGEKFKQIIFLI